MFRVGVDTETYGLDWRRQGAFFLSVVDSEGGAESVDLRAGMDPRQIDRFLSKIERADQIFFHHAKFDLHALRKLGLYSVAWWPRIRDTIIREYLLDEHRTSYRLDDVAQDRLGRRKIDIVAETGVLPQHWHTLPREVVRKYCEEDARLTLEIGMDQQRELEEQELLDIERLEIQTLEVVFHMEQHGVRVDPELAGQARDTLHRQMLQQLQVLYSKHGKFWPGSPTEVARVLRLKQDNKGWHTPDGFRIPSTATGKPQLDEAVMSSIPGELPKQILHFKYLEKMANTFLGNHILSNQIERDGQFYVYPNINSTKSVSGRGTNTGRLSYDSPALQQIPSRKKEAAAIIKPIFLPDPGEHWVYGDLAQNEFRVFAHFTGSEDLYAIYRENPQADFHQMVADLTGLPRSATKPGEANAKQVNLALLFNMGAGLLAQTMGLPYTDDGEGYLAPGPEVLEVLEQYHARIPGVREINQRCARLVEINGFVRTLAGRRIRIPDPEFSYKAAGLLFQAVAADNNKRNLVLLHEALKEFGEGRVVVNIHDEYSLSLPWSPRAEEFLEHVKNEISDAGLRVPLSIDWSWGSDWFDAL